MTSTTYVPAEWPSLPEGIAPEAAHTSAKEACRELAVAQVLDRCTTWPTHRIRCFLQSPAGKRRN